MPVGTKQEARARASSFSIVARSPNERKEGRTRVSDPRSQHERFRPPTSCLVFPRLSRWVTETENKKGTNRECRRTPLSTIPYVSQSVPGMNGVAPARALVVSDFCLLCRVTHRAAPIWISHRARYIPLYFSIFLSLSLSLFRFALCVLISFYRSPSCHGSFPLRALLNQREMGERTNDRPLLGLTCPGRVVWDVPYTSARGINEWNWVQRYIGTYYTTVEVTTFASRTTRIFPKLAFGVRVISACS